MPKKSRKATIRVTLNITSAELVLIDRAAKLTGKSRGKFALEAALRAADENLPTGARRDAAS